MFPCNPSESATVLLSYVSDHLYKFFQRGHINQQQQLLLLFSLSLSHFSPQSSSSSLSSLVFLLPFKNPFKHGFMFSLSLSLSLSTIFCNFIFVKNFKIFENNTCKFFYYSFFEFPKVAVVFYFSWDHFDFHHFLLIADNNTNQFHLLELD